MGADIGEGPRWAAACGVDAPVLVAGAEQPVLQISGVNGQQSPGLTLAEPGAGFPHHRVVAVDERNGPKQTSLGGAGQHGTRSSRIRGQGLLTDDVRSRIQRLQGLCGVDIVGSADVDRIEGATKKFVGRSRGLEAQLDRRLCRSVRPRRCDGVEHGSGRACGTTVDTAHEPAAEHCDAQIPCPRSVT